MKSKNFVLRFVITALAFIASLSSMAEIEKEYHFENDGFEWYEITDTDSSLSGAQDANGNTIIPTKYDIVMYWPGIKSIENNLDTDGHFTVRVWEKSHKKDSYGLDIIYEGVYTKDGKYIIPTDKQFRYTSKCSKEVNGTRKEFFEFQRGDTFNEYGICDANGKVLFMRRVDKSVSYLIMWESYYSLHLYTPEYGKSSQKCETAGIYFFDFEHNLIGTEKDYSYEEVAKIAKQKNLRNPLADAPAKATPNNSASASSQYSTGTTQSEHSSVSNTVDLRKQSMDLMMYHWREEDGFRTYYFDADIENSELVYELVIKSDYGTITKHGTWSYTKDYLILDDKIKLKVTSFSEKKFVLNGVTYYRVE